MTCRTLRAILHILAIHELWLLQRWCLEVTYLALEGTCLVVAL